MVARAVRSRAPLGQRNVNVENASSNGNAGNGKLSSILPPLKKDSARSLLLARTASGSSSTASTLAGSEHTASSAQTENNHAFHSLSSDVLRRALGTAGSLAKDDRRGAPGKKQPLAASQEQNRGPVRATAVPTKPVPGASHAPVTIVEHRKRPGGDGYTVHKYLQGKLLGKGGFAKVYKVTSLDTNKEYAVKIVPKANLVKSRARQKLQTEIKIHRTMKHANICEYKHFFEDKVNCYILLELCHNHSTNEMLKRRKFLTEEETRLLMVQIVDAVAFMHGSNVIHRDLKLGNLFLSKSMQVKVGDFGLACRVDSKDEKRKTICGTPNYIAPEVIEGDKAKRGHSFEVDVWSLGVVCYTMLCGRPPYEAKDVKSTYRRILANEYSFPQGRAGEDARDLIGAMLQTDPKRRPSLNEIRQHAFFTMHRIPASLPPTCCISAPIWSTDEFGELEAIKPTSALDVRLRSSVPSSKQPLPVAAGVLSNKNAGSTGNGKDIAKKAAFVKSVAAAGAFHIYDDVNDKVECKLDSQTRVLANDAKQVRDLTDHMATCDLDGEARDMPPVSSSSPPGASSLSVEPAARSSIGRGEAKQIIPSSREKEVPTASPSQAPTASSPQSSLPASSEDLQELVTMHHRLEECLANYARIQNGGAKVECPLKGGEVWGTNTWVTRYVDYTSKYGLGFLLNDGSSGVYFNDSTKAVHPAVGDSFAYVERKKTCAGGEVREPVSMYTLANYPEDTLKKKVTLLQHFRSYLLEQQKRAEDAGEAEPLTQAGFEEARPSSVDDNGDHAGTSIVFMKKWIKTKHAMLFRLSNGTVQVLFYDLTEVLISSEGNLITFVDKEKNRFVHSVAEIANKQHGDVSRRLKYAKEILSQLISASKR